MNLKSSKLLATIINSRVMPWIVLGVTMIASGAVILFFVVQTLQQAPPEIEVGYDIFEQGGDRVQVNPSQAYLLETMDSEVAFYFPEGAYEEGGTLVMQPRRMDLIPVYMTGNWTRQNAVDLVFIDSDGNFIEHVRLQRSALLCFNLNSSQQELLAASQEAISVHYFNQNQDTPGWEDVRVGAGWQENQICGLIEHLSLYALAINTSMLQEEPINLLMDQVYPTAAPKMYDVRQ
ncbi:MAG: hypothetical protein K8R91_05755 [Phycisphaerae bacterium]|nr:hypothetical protein [Phycisphaerae bacterium]